MDICEHFANRLSSRLSDALVRGSGMAVEVIARHWDFTLRAQQDFVLCQECDKIVVSSFNSTLCPISRSHAVVVRRLCCTYLPVHPLPVDDAVHGSVIPVFKGLHVFAWQLRQSCSTLLPKRRGKQCSPGDHQRDANGR
jgi:hypothetical protein